MCINSLSSYITVTSPVPVTALPPLLPGANSSVSVKLPVYTSSPVYPSSSSIIGILFIKFSNMSIIYRGNRQSMNDVANGFE